MNLPVTSAERLVLKKIRNTYFTVIVGNGDPVIWRIPKGMKNENETIEETVVREIQKESGVFGQIVDLIDIGYWTYKYDGKDWDETCYFYLLKFVKGSIENHDNEYAFVKWVNIKKAESLLFYDIEKNVSSKIAHFITIYDFFIS